MYLLGSKEISEIFERFKAQNPEPKPELNYYSPYTLLVAVVLSAQTTDKGVNKVTERLFRVADTPEKMDRYVKTIYNKAADMEKLINELTVYSGIDNNRIPYHFHKILVGEYFRDCIEEVGMDLENKNFKLLALNLN